MLLMLGAPMDPVNAAAILIVEDEQIVALELKDRLTRMGHSVVGIVTSGEEAIEDSRRLRPDLIVMDIKLQGELDGIAAAAAIRKELDTAIVYLTAYADETTLERAKVTQPYGYVLKPFHERELHVVIEIALYRHRIERDNARLYADAQRATAMRDEVLAIVSHDLRNPLATIGMAAEQLIEQAEKLEPHRVMKNASAIRWNAQRMERLIDDLIDVGRVDTGRLSIELQRVSTSSLVADALSIFEPIVAECSIRLVSLPFRDADVRCDRGRVLQVLSNLIGNAVKFSPRGGVIRIGGAPGRGVFQFSVSDQGKGLASDQLGHVFERYWQAPETRHRGSGLGLYIAKGIVDAHGGQIWVDSVQGRGSTFHFTIPLAPQGADQLSTPA
jgi:signal transduction histidine kinase